MEQLFANSEPTCSPAPWSSAYNGVKKLCSILEEMERIDLLSDLASFGSQMINQEDQNKLESITKNGIYIDYFTFADGTVELSNLREQFYYKIEDTPWAIWEEVAAISWCYRTPANYWKNKRLRYSSRFYRKESWLRLNLHGMWQDINQIKRNTRPEEESVFQRKRLGTYFNRLCANVLVYLEKYQIIEKFHFFLDSDCLWIVLETPKQSFQFFKIKEFNEQKKIFGFVSQLARAYSLTSFDIPHGYTATSLLSHLNMPAKSQLAKLFFNGWSSHHIHFKGRVISTKMAEQEIYIPELLVELYQT